MATPPAALTDAEVAQELRQRVDATVDASVDATRRMVRAAEETRESGARTLGMLDEQQARIDRLDHGLDTVQTNLEESQRQLTIFERATCGLCGRGKRRRAAAAAAELEMKPTPARPASAAAASAGKAAKTTTTTAAATAAATPPDGPMRRIVNDAREDEMEANLDVVGDILADLRLQSAQMAETLDAQNEQLGRISGKADTNLGLVANVNKRTAALL